MENLPATGYLAPPVVELRNISITFPGVKALDQVDLTLRQGEVHALMGENGAGKSTLIKVLTGVYRPDDGLVKVAGRPVRFNSPAEAQTGGISTVYQEVNLCNNLSVAENIMLGHEVRRGPFIDWPATRRAARVHLARLRLEHVDPASMLGNHSLAVQQLCAIARAMVVQAKVLILDEPTSSLDKAEVAELFAVIRELRDAGVAILFVSHFLDQVYEISDYMTVLRNGKLVGEYLTKDLPRMELISAMVGRAGDELADIEKGVHATARDVTDSAELVSASGLGRQGGVEPFDLTVRAGEIVGFAGLLGSGRTEAARLIYGADKPDQGTLLVMGESVKNPTPLKSLKQGVVLSSEDRRKEGIIGDLTVRENIALAIQANRGALNPIPAKELDEIVKKYIAALDINPPNPNALIKNLSGGNQQKVLLARWLATSPKLLILDEPTRGIDVGAKTEIQKLVANLATEGMAVIFISSEIEEVLRLSHEVVVMRDRRKVKQLFNDGNLTVRQVMETIAAVDTTGDGGIESDESAAKVGVEA